MRVHRIEVPIRPPTSGPARPGFPSGTVNAWLLPEPPVTLVDCGPDFPEAVDLLAAGFRAAGVPLRSLEQIVVTHAHPDHGGAAGRLSEATGAAVFVHEADLKPMRDPAGYRAVRWRETEQALAESGADPQDLAQARERFAAFAPLAGPAPRTRPFSGTLIEAGGATLEVLPVPGHTPGHVALHAPRERVLFTGDALLEKITANANALTVKSRDALGQHLSALERLLALPACEVHPGHGAPFRDHGAVIARDLVHHARRGDRILRILEPGPRAAREVVQKLFLGRVDVTFALGEALGHLAQLEKGSLVASELAGGVRRWALAAEGAARLAGGEE